VPLRTYIELVFSRARLRAPVLMVPPNYAALLSLGDRDHWAAVEYWRDALGVARSTFQSLHWDTYYTSLKALDVVTSGIIRRARTLRLDTMPKSATPAQLRALLADLLDEGHMTRGVVRVWCAERQLYLEFFAALKDGRTGVTFSTERDEMNRPTRLERIAIRLIEPALDLKAEALLRETTEAIAALEHANEGYRAVVSRLPAQRTGATQTGAYPVDWMIFTSMVHHFENSARFHFRSLARRRAAAVAVALRLYAQDHAGAAPGTLKELVPKYLPAVPADPFADGKSPLGYVTSPRPVVYSVGENGSDDLKNGTWPFPRLPQFGSDAWQFPDTVFELQ
jgi:hypothetical protein